MASGRSTTATLLTTIQLATRTLPIYDSGLIFPSTQSRPASQDAVLAFYIPSSRYWYPALNGASIPYPALTSDQEQQRRDLSAWLRPVSPTVYAEESFPSTTPESDLFKIIEGRRVVVTLEQRDRYIRDLTQVLEELRHNPRENEQFGLQPRRKLVEQIIDYPFNPAADYIRASQLANDRDTAAMQAYLDEVGVIHFKGSDIAQLDPEDVFFMLTRFYGPPVAGNLETKVNERKYLTRSRNERTRALARAIPEHIATFNILRQEFDLYFNAINDDPDNEAVWTGLGATNKERFYNDFFAYLFLLRRPDNLPPLTLNTIKQLPQGNRQRIIAFLTNYPDSEIVNLVGTRPDQEQHRPAFLNEVAQILTNNRTFLLFPTEANLCNNPESILTLEQFAESRAAFIGRGSLANGFDCYQINELFQSFDNNRADDGTITFRDPLHYEANFRVADLREFRDAVNSGREGLPSSPELTAKFDEYISQAEIQTSSDYQALRRLREWRNESPENRLLMKEYWITYFEMGMYMRQWRGPGHPYPTGSRETGHEHEIGSDIHIQIGQSVGRLKGILDDALARMPDDIAELVRNLTVMKNFEGRSETAGTTIMARYREVITRGTYCIRMASGPWAFTGAYYLKQILNEDIPGYSLDTPIAYIQ